MNKIIEEYYPIFEMYQAMRQQLMDILTDEDLAYHPGGDNVPLGVLCRELGEVEKSYIESFKTFKLDFSYRYEKAEEVENNVSHLAAWFTDLDNELKRTIQALSDEDLAAKVIDRGPDFKLPPHINLTVYNEALLIFYGKVTVYLKAMGKERPSQWQHWLG